MRVPEIAVAIYPASRARGKRGLQYLQLAPANVDASAIAQISLQLAVSNNEPSAIILERISIVFGSAYLDREFVVDASITPGGQLNWYATNEQYLLPSAPPPSSFTLALHFKDFDPWQDTIEITRFMGTFLFPGKARDLESGEFWIGEGATHAGGGDQIFHYDLGVTGWDHANGIWSEKFPGKDDTSNGNFRIWNKPVYAIADGTVTFFENEVTENPTPGQISAEGQTKGHGNAFNIQHGPYIGTYMHMRKGSLNPGLLGVGKRVKAGQFLGRAGNAGHAFKPHLHVGLVIRNAEGAQFSIPLPFSSLPSTGVRVVQDSLLNPLNVNDVPWVIVSKQGLPYIDGNSRAVIRLSRKHPPRAKPRKKRPPKKMPH